MTISTYLAKYLDKATKDQPAPAPKRVELPPPAVWHVLGVLTELGDLEGLTVEFLHGGGVTVSVHDAPSDSVRRLLTRLGIDPICGRPGPLSTGRGSWLSFRRGDCYAGSVDVLWFCADPPAALEELLEVQGATR
jgi:hypothetical protein